MKRTEKALLASTLLTASALCASAADFHPISGISIIQGSTFYAVENLVQGFGVGFDSAEPHNQLGGGGGDWAWVTDGSGADYYDAGGGIGPTPIFVFDLGSDVLLSEISTWGYADTNSNGARDFSLRFATDAEGAAGFGTSIADQTGFIAGFNYGPRSSNPLTTNVTARYVEMTITDNWRGLDPGGTPGGDRVGLGEVAFELILVAGEPNITTAPEVTPALAFDSTTTFDIAITNTGEQDLIITGTNLTGANSDDFIVTNIVSPVGSLTTGNITLEFDPAGLGGPIAATLQIMSNDPDTPTTEVVITASLPELFQDISAPVSVSLTAGGVAETLTIPIDNLGRLQLEISNTSITGPNSANFVVTVVPNNIAALASDSIQIAFDPAGLAPPATLSATLQITSNDPDSPAVDVLLNGSISEIFYPISSVTSATADSDFFPAENLIEGVGVGFDTNWPHDRTSSSTWVTNAPNGGVGDYFDPVPEPSAAIVFDLGSEVGLGEVSFWGYADTNANGANLFSLRFATEADGPTGFGTSIIYNPRFAPVQDQTPRQSFEFDQGVIARYVEWVPLDNFFGINPPGGDRVGAGEIAFAVRSVAGDKHLEVLSTTYDDGKVSLTFNSRPNAIYGVFRSPDLGISDWEELNDSYASQGDVTTFEDNSLPVGTKLMFYQIRTVNN